MTMPITAERRLHAVAALRRNSSTDGRMSGGATSASCPATSAVERCTIARGRPRRARDGVRRRRRDRRRARVHGRARAALFVAASQPTFVARWVLRCRGLPNVAVASGPKISLRPRRRAPPPKPLAPALERGGAPADGGAGSRPRRPRPEERTPFFGRARTSDDAVSRPGDGHGRRRVSRGPRRGARRAGRRRDEGTVMSAGRRTSLSLSTRANRGPVGAQRPRRRRSAVRHARVCFSRRKNRVDDEATGRAADVCVPDDVVRRIATYYPRRQSPRKSSRGTSCRIGERFH